MASVSNIFTDPTLTKESNYAFRKNVLRSIKLTYDHKNYAFSYIIDDQEITWYKAKEIDKDFNKAVKEKVKFKEYKKTWAQLISSSKILPPNTIFLNQQGIDMFILGSSQDLAIKLKRILVEKVIPDIRKTGKYE